jgi:hypothetical protein
LTSGKNPTTNSNPISNPISPSNQGRSIVNNYNWLKHLVKRLISNLFVERSVYSHLNPEFTTYLDIQLSPSSLCSSSQNDDKQYVFVYVLSAIKSFERRQLIRKTWANNKNLRVAFIIGKSNDQFYEQLIQIEQNNYDDIIQGNFIDSYRILSYKSITAWKWFTDNCDPKLFKFIIKIDDDVILNSYYLNDILSTQNIYNIQNLTSTFLCTVFTGYSPDKDPASKYYVNDNEYNVNLYEISYYSDYCFGPGFLMNVDLAANLYSQSLGIKLFWLDDAYVGILARYANATFKHYDKGLYWDKSDSLNINLSTILFIRNIETNSDFNRIWNILTR